MKPSEAAKKLKAAIIDGDCQFCGKPRNLGGSNVFAFEACSEAGTQQINLHSQCVGPYLLSVVEERISIGAIEAEQTLPL